MGELNPAQKRVNAAALLPILVFLVLYLVCGLLFESRTGPWTSTPS